MDRHSDRKRKLRLLLLRGHRWVGVLAAWLVLLLAFTGILLNHTHTLGLDAQALRSRWLLSMYGVEIEVPRQGAVLKSVWLAEMSGQLHVNGRPVGTCLSPFVGAVPLQGFGVAALCADFLYLLTLDGELIERLPSPPGTATGLGSTPDRLVARGGDRLWLLDPDAGEWGAQATSDPGAEQVTWGRLSGLSPGHRETLEQQGVASDLTWERLLLDVHSGRLFGPIGVTVVDLGGVAMMWLAATGLWTWWARPRRPRH